MFVAYKTLSSSESKVVELGCDFIITQLKTPRGTEITIKGWFGTQEIVKGFRVFSVISYIGEKTVNILKASLQISRGLNKVFKKH